MAETYKYECDISGVPCDINDDKAWDAFRETLRANNGILPKKSLKDLFELKTDSYKHAHWKMYPYNTTKVYSYLESRGGKFNEVVWSGLHYILQEHFVGKLITPSTVERAKEFVDEHMGPGVFNYDGWMYIAKELGGILPLKIKALPEGTVVPNHCALMTVENTDDKCAFLTNFAETLLVQAWYSTTVATNSREMLKIVKKYLEETADNTESLPFKLHDFGFRGSTAWESSAVGGAAHLINSSGTDTMSALIVAAEYYNAGMAGLSIPATEHSIMCSWTRAGEYEGVLNLLKQHPVGLVACVSDTYNIFNACKHYATDLKELIMSREGTFVVRPDSGDPPEVVAKCLNILWEGYKEEGSMVGKNKQYKLLPSQIRMIQGDGIDHAMIEKILERMKEEGFSAENIAFGSGGGLLQKVNRDTLKMAFKASSYIVDGVRRDERKDPITDPGKRSKLGIFAVVERNGELVTVQQEEAATNGEKDLLETVFLNGEILVSPTFEEVRKRAAII